jgi:hypothetical protein
MREWGFQEHALERVESINVQCHEFFQVNGSHAIGLTVGDILERIG